MFGALQAQISHWLQLSGLDESNFKVLFCALLLFPFSGIFKRLPDHNYNLKNYYVIGVAAFYVFGILNLTSGLQTLLISSGGCYFITRYFKSSLMPWVNFLFLMGHLAFSHFHEQFFNVYDPTVIDITGAQMVMVMKLSAFGWNVHDGTQDPDTLGEFAKSRAIKEHPSLLPFIGYVFFYPSLLTGPAFDFVDYDKFIHGTLFEDVPEDKRPGKRKRLIPRSGRPALKRVLQGLAWALLFTQAPKYVSTEYTLSAAFLDRAFVFRIFYLWVLGLSYRLKYYTIWLIAEGACILCGIGYNGYDESTQSFKWDRVRNIDPWAFETGQNVHTCLEAWNMNTNKWLKHYVYTRVAKKGKRPGFKSTLFTFATSAFWHGTRPGYYLTFVMGAFLQTLGKIYRRNLRPMFLNGDGSAKKSKVWYDVVCYVSTQLAFGFVAQPFVILELGPSLRCWASTYFYVPVVVAVTLFLFKGPFAKQVIGFCKARHPKKSVLLPHEAEKVKKISDDVPTLGLPSLEDLESANADEVQRELAELWHSIKDRQGWDMDAARKAYANFATEVNHIVSERGAAKVHE